MAINSYQQAARVNKKSLGELIRENTIAGNSGTLGSITGAISDKMAAKSKGFKEKFDYLNITRMLMGNTMSALVGRATGRKKEDIEYFANKGIKNKKGQANQVNERTGGNNLSNIEPALYTNISDGQKQKMRKGDGVADVLARLYNLMKGEYIAEAKKLKIEKNFKKGKNKDKEKWHKQLLSALSKQGGTSTATPEKQQKEGFNFLDFIGNIFKNVAAMVEKIITSIAEALWGAIKFLTNGLATVAEMLGLKKLAEKALSRIGNSPKAEAEKPKKQTQKFTKEQEAALDKEYGKKIEKATDKEIEKKATKAGLKESAKSAGKSVLKKLPFGLGLGAATYFAYDRLQQGDVVGAGLELASGVASVVPVVGTALSATIDAVSIGRDLRKSTLPNETQPTPTAIPEAPQANPITTRVQSAIDENVNLENAEFTGTQNIVVDASKNINSVGGKGQNVLLDSTVTVRTDDPTLKKITIQNLRPT
jgi:hypothetical protein